MIYTSECSECDSGDINVNKSEEEGGLSRPVKLLAFRGVNPAEIGKRKILRKIF